MRRSLFTLGIICLIAPIALIAAPKDPPKNLPANNTTPGKNNEVIEMLGEVVRVDPDQHTIVLKRGIGENATQTEYKVAASAKFWGVNRKPLSEGLHNSDIRAGSTVWVRLEPSDTPNTITDLRVFSPPEL